LNGFEDPGGMNAKLHIDAHELMREIARYLAVVDAFRAERCEPTWLPEPAPRGAAKARRSTSCRTRTSRTHLA
jgi:hypothetical protein